MRLALGLVVILSACGADDGGATHQHDAAVDSSSQSDALTDAALDAPPGTQPLTVKNILSWCRVYVNGDSVGSTGSSIVVNVLPGTIPIKATAAGNPSLFKITANMWHLTDGDSGSGETGTVTGTGDTAESAVTATVSGSAGKCVWVCCPFKDDGHGCDSTNTDPNDCP